MSEAAGAWRHFLAVCADADRWFLDGDVVMSDPIDLAEAYRHMATLVGYALDWFVAASPDEPVLLRSFNTDEPSEKKYLGDNADTRYFHANVRSRHEYRIRGRRGDEVYLSFVVHAGHPTDSLRQHAVSNLNHEQLIVDSDGGFEIVLSARRHDGNWLYLPEDAACLISREYYVDRDRARSTSGTGRHW